MSYFHEWQLEKTKELPDLARRVFALRNSHYSGCGFHYSLERLLGNVIASVMDYERLATIGKEEKEKMAHSLISEVLYEELIDRLAIAETQCQNNPKI